MSTDSGGSGSGTVPFLADACAEIPSPEIVRYSLLRLNAIGYLDRFGGYLRQLGLSREAVDDLLTLDPEKMLNTIEGIGAEQGWLDEPTAHLRSAGVSLVIAVSEAGLDPKEVFTPDPEQLIDWYADLPMDARVWVGVSPDPAMLARARRLADHRAFAGISISPFLVGKAIDDETYRPVLEWAADAGVPVWMHCSAHYRRSVSYTISHPSHLDEALRRFPDLRVLVGHAGWPWVGEYVIVALRHPGLGIELSTFPPRLLVEPGWGLSPLVAQRKALTGRVFFGSGSVFSERNYSSLIAQIDALDIASDIQSWKGEGLRAWLERLMTNPIDPVVEPSICARSYPEVETLGQLLCHWLAVCPESEAISFVEGPAWTWADLASRVALAQSHLRGAAVEPGDRVGLVCDNSCEMVAALVAVVTMGATAVPVNTALTSAGIQEVIRHSQPRVVFAGEEHLARCDPTATGIETRPARGLLDASVSKDPSLVVHGGAEDLAMIIYSSGTTGTGKGVMLSHGVCLTASAACAGVQFEACSDDRIFTCLPLFHCAAQQMGLWTCLVSGATLVLDRGFHPERFWNTLRNERATAFHFIGPMLSRWWDQRGDGLSADGIRLASGGGPRKAWEGFEEHFGVPLVECYGMTEVFGGCVSHRPGRARPWTLGRPMEHVEVRIDNPQPWEDGTSRGEIQIRPVRPNVMFSGYFRDPERSARAWVDGWYRTGDIGSWTEDGLLVYHSRVDDVIRRRGENVSAVELETALSQVSGVRECAVTGIATESGDAEILVAVVPDDATRGIDLDRFWNEAAALIPRFALPRYVLVTDELPKTATDRVQRHRLQERLAEASVRISSAEGH